MLPPPPPVLIALSVFGAALGVVIAAWRMISPLLRAFLRQRIAESDREKLHGAVKGAFDIVAAAAKLTPGRDVLDGLEEALGLFERDVRATLGRDPTDNEREQARLQLLARHASEATPGTLGRGDAAAALRREPPSSR